MENNIPTQTPASPEVKHPKLIGVLLIAMATLIPLSAAGWFGYQNIQLKKQLSQSAQITPTLEPSPTAIPTKSETITPSEKPVNAKKLSYKLPEGWKMVTNSTGTFEMGYDPANTQLVEGAVEGISLRKLRPDPKLGYASFMSIGLYDYNGGSRHQFIYKYLGETPVKEDLMPDYKEIEYLYNGRSCLFLNGISISQYPTVWGMCVAHTNDEAFLITAYDSANYEITLQTIRQLLRL